jgi:hypothetical protein
MGLVTKPHTFLTGGTILASEVNADFDTLYTLVNGNIEAANIASGAVGENELAALAVTNAKVSASAAIAMSKLAALTASIVPVADASGFLTSSAVTATELGYVSGVTSAIQTQLAGKQDTLAAADVRALGFFDTTNDGTGSGLDADMVDGVDVLTGSAALGSSNISSGAARSDTITVTGAAVGDPAAVSLIDPWPAGIVTNAYVSAVDTVTVTFFNADSVTKTRPAGTYKAIVFN